MAERAARGAPAPSFSAITAFIGGGGGGVVVVVPLLLGIAHKDFRLGTIDAIRFIALLQVVDNGALSEFTTGGRPSGVAPIHMICSGKDKQPERVDIIREVVRLSASPSLKVKGNESSPLHRAAGTGADKIVEELLRAGAHVNAVNDAGATPYDAALSCSEQAATLNLKEFLNKAVSSFYVFMFGWQPVFDVIG